MAKATMISAEMTVRQLVSQWPACASVMERQPLAKIGGRWSLQELGWLARSAGMEPSALLEELSNMAGVGIGERVVLDRERSPMGLILLALGIALTLGAGWGVVLLLRIAFGGDYGAVSSASVHIHGLAQLWGWMALFIFAIGTHLLRKNTPHPAPALLERIAAVAIALGTVLFFGQLAVSDGARAALGIGASAMMGVAAICFAISVGWSLGGRGQRPQRWHWFVLLGSAWLLVWMVVEAVVRVRLGDGMTPAEPARRLLIELPIFGFATSAIYGFGIRLIPGLLNIGQLRPSAFLLTIWLHNVGLVLLLVGGRWGSLVGAVLMLAGALSYLVGMDGLRSKPSREIFGIDPHGGILIRVGFFWLVAGLVMVVIQQAIGDMPHPFTGAWRHALTVGFITTMILGVGQRLLPIIIKQPLASLGMMRVSAGLLIVGNLGRVGLELATIGHWTWAYRWMGGTGVLELTAIGLFAANVCWTMRNRQHLFVSGDRLRADTRVREAINQHPRLQQDLHELGVTMLSESPFVAPSLTFGAMALAWGMSPDALLEQLRERGMR